MEIRIDKIEWIDEFLKKIWELSVQKVLNKSIKKSIFTLEREAKLVTPVDTWLLRNSYETNFENLEWRLRNFREYGVYVEARVWFMERTINDNESKIYAIFEKDIEEFLNDLTK